MIKEAIKTRLNKEVKGIQKLYQATVNGDSAESFHRKCDNVSNTLILVSAEGGRRFGGFTTIQWNHQNLYINDQNAFLFSLDRMKIHSIKNSSQAVYPSNSYGPLFGRGHDLYIPNNCLSAGVYSKQTDYDLGGDNTALKNNDYQSKCNDYEVFKILF